MQLLERAVSIKPNDPDARFLRGLPRRYLSVFGLSTIYQHVRLARGLLPGEVHASLEKRDDIWELTVAALDKPYLFSNIAGVLSHFGMNIHRGQAMTTPDHLVLDIFEFSRGECSFAALCAAHQPCQAQPADGA